MAKGKGTWNPSKVKRRRTHGFLKRMASRVGQLVIKRRRAKGRSRLTIEVR